MSEDGMSEDEQAVWDAMRAVYAAVLAGDSAAADEQLHPDVTIWDSEETAMVRGTEGLAVLRARRPTGGPRLLALDAGEPVVEVWGETALLRHVLRVRIEGRAPQVVRNTSVWRRSGGRWRAVHNHEDVVAG